MWLAKWVNEQKQVYAGKRSGKVLREDQVRRLEKIGMEWGRRKVEDRNQENRELDEVQPEKRNEGSAQRNIA